MAKFSAAANKERKQQEKENQNVISDPELRKKFKQQLVVITNDLSLIDQRKEAIRETIAQTAVEYKIDKKHVRKMANTMYKSNYGSLLEENRHFEILYETVVEGKLRDPDSTTVPDPLDADDEDDEDSDQE